MISNVYLDIGEEVDLGIEEVDLGTVGEEVLL